MPRTSLRVLLGAATALSVVAGGAALVAPVLTRPAVAQTAAAPQAVPVSIAVVQPRDVTPYDEFSGRLEAIERVEVRARVAGAILNVHFKEGELVKAGDSLVTIDPAPYAAEVDRLQAQVVAAEAQVALTKSDLERGQRLFDNRTVAQRDLDERLNASRSAEANLKAAQAALRAAQLNLDYTEVRAPVSGRVGKIEITAGNLVTGGGSSALLTTLVSLNPIYAGFSADEQSVLRALRGLGHVPRTQAEIRRIPVDMITAEDDAAPVRGHMQLIDNQIDARSGTIRVRAVFDNPTGDLIPGQFVRLRMGQPKTAPTLLVSERAVGTDQNKKFVYVVGADNKATYREVALGPSLDGMRIVTAGLADGDRIIVNGLQKVRPGALVNPEIVPMNVASASPAKGSTDVAQR
ncbi:MexE family multidrug efflux RND transporter periplasmic adaptor subunit [Azorhizobium oxalatiphilum]|uniref:MexE family multidrug efflux RND transporter periplasmic adaptor subunit n=1 Tax=Azorhizobium oxalatiphilum TaxID=980631 RepID=A0A917BUK7_9HYPH|nr:efflux RND transporter periplasmic adaptor subunit [Azorhizobium oxalatiphilum]GGF57365.1 MexE family multidrug efflux RND transporter periplasmic adaptor subunit [Azorhizobium oxalatiphilum]